MHLRGKDMKYEVIYPDGRQETLLSVPNYNFNWQTLYKAEKPIELPKGTRLMVTAHYDNSEKNKYNPDPTKTVRFGDPTYDEMMVGYFDFVTKVPMRKAVTLNTAIYDKYAGEYSIGPATFTIAREGDHLMFTAPGQPKFEAFPESENVFFFKVIDAQVTFIRNEAGNVTELLFEINGRKLKARKVERTAGSAK
jgi:hypothetical protein